MSLTWEDSGIILSVRPHGEAGGIVSLLTREHGRVAGYVYGVTSSKLRGVLETGNLIAVQFQAKSHDQLGSFACEIERNYAAGIMDEAVKLTALQSACALLDKTMPEREKHSGLFEGTLALLESFDTDIWAATYIYWEMGLLKELGFGLDLSKCVVTGAVDDLLYVSPKSGCAVCESAGEIYKEKLLKLPPFLRGQARFEEEDILEGLRLTGHFLLHRVFALSNSNLPEPRLRLEGKYVK